MPGVPHNITASAVMDELVRTRDAPITTAPAPVDPVAPVPTRTFSAKTQHQLGLLKTLQTSYAEAGYGPVSLQETLRLYKARQASLKATVIEKVYDDIGHHVEL